VEADLDHQVLALLIQPLAHRLVHGEGGANAVPRGREGRHHRITDGLHHRAVVLAHHIGEHVEVTAHDVVSD